ncbi:hypothetical protein IQ249_11045 [Lusitaniella coriacea LEGE 07157]|uniref:Uncharacterized protein n=1 Tax=Lusitaniella coriacea LEGE 07157 TaxID=945747 RepID=A0A8J7DWZ4_9CYAN|nr:hypothetical protein [Lusitaniella coriacea]MBE9116435.1 hypothetical protein [Lusitaniella coriacea LEGE 07157]
MTVSANSETLGAILQNRIDHAIALHNFGNFNYNIMVDSTIIHPQLTGHAKQLCLQLPYPKQKPPI